MLTLLALRRADGKKLSWELSRLYGDPLPSGALLTRLEEHTRIYERDDGEGIA